LASSVRQEPERLRSPDKLSELSLLPRVWSRFGKDDDGRPNEEVPLACLHQSTTVGAMQNAVESPCAVSTSAFLGSVTSMGDCQSGESGAIWYPKLLINIVQMNFYGAFRKIETATDLLV
jgi:hypothetical protein